MDRRTRPDNDVLYHYQRDKLTFLIEYNNISNSLQTYLSVVPSMVVYFGNSIYTNKDTNSKTIYLFNSVSKLFHFFLLLLFFLAFYFGVKSFCCLWSSQEQFHNVYSVGCKRSFPLRCVLYVRTYKEILGWLPGKTDVFLALGSVLLISL